MTDNNSISQARLERMNKYHNLAGVPTSTFLSQAGVAVLAEKPRLQRALSKSNPTSPRSKEAVAAKMDETALQRGGSGSRDHAFHPSAPLVISPGGTRRAPSSDHSAHSYSRPSSTDTVDSEGGDISSLSSVSSLSPLSVGVGAGVSYSGDSDGEGTRGSSSVSLGESTSPASPRQKAGSLSKRPLPL